MKYLAAAGAAGMCFLSAAAAPGDPTPLHLSRIEGLPFTEPEHFIPHGDRVLFQALSVPAGGGPAVPGVWVTGGTATSTHKLVVSATDPTPGQQLVGVVGQFVLVNAWSPSGAARGLYALDLLSSKTERLRLGHAWQAVVAGDRLFVAMEGGGLYATDGTARGTRLVRAGHVGVGMSQVGRQVVFLAEVPTPTGPESGLFRADTLGSQLLAEPGGLGFLSRAGERVFFPRVAGAGHDLWVTDGSVAGTQPVLSPAPDVLLGSCAGRLLYTQGPVPEATELGATDGTPEGTAVVTVLPGPVYGPFGLADGGNPCFLYLGGPSATSGLWKTDLTAGGTERVADVYLSLIHEPALGARGRAFFSAFDGDHGAELWTSDGTEGGTGLLGDLLPGSLGSSPAEFTRVGGRVFFSAMNEGFGRDLWLIDLPPGITIEDASAREQSGRPMPAVFRVRLSHPSNHSVTVDFETEGGTAEPLRDFAPASGSLAFAPGETLKTVRVLVLADALAEGQEEFAVRLTNPANAELDRDRAIGTIRGPGPRLAGPRP